MQDTTASRLPHIFKFGSSDPITYQYEANQSILAPSKPLWLWAMQATHFMSDVARMPFRWYHAIMAESDLRPPALITIGAAN